MSPAVVGKMFAISSPQVQVAVTGRAQRVRKFVNTGIVTARIRNRGRMFHAGPPTAAWIRATGKANREGSVLVELSHALTHDLTLLSDALEKEITYTAPVLDRLVPRLTGCLTGTILGFLGLTITVLLDGTPVIINTLEELDTGNVGGSLLLTLLPMGSANTTGTVVFYSDGAAVFNDLAESARWIFNLKCDPLIDSDLSAA